MSTRATGTVEISAVSFHDPVAQLLVQAVQQEYVARYGGPDQTPIEPDEFSPPTGLFLVARASGVPVGCAGLRRLDTDVAEVKRMYVEPSARRGGVGRQLLVYLEDAAREAGYRRLVLETGYAQPEALALYTSAGYQPVTPYGVYRCHAGASSLGKALE